MSHMSLELPSIHFQMQLHYLDQTSLKYWKLQWIILEISEYYTNKLSLLEESSNRFLTMGEISSKILINLVEDILDLAKIEAGTFSFNKEPFQIKALINEIKFIFGLQWQQKGIELIFNWSRYI